MRTQSRSLVNIIEAVSASDGIGVKLHRIGGGRLHKLLDPFLMLDEINSDDAADYIGGFPEHPHRGFETITYMKTGRMRHRDHMGNEGVIGAGDLQWMTAGKGVLHSEMPEQDQGKLQGFQIWLNLPASEKMQPPAYREIINSTIPEVTLNNGGCVRIIAGEVTTQLSTEARAKTVTGVLPKRPTEPVMVDVNLTSNESVSLAFASENPVLVYVYGGYLHDIGYRQMGVFSKGDNLMLEAGKTGAKLLILSGKQLNEPVVQYGPFVMNSQAEIQQAIQAFRTNSWQRGGG